jgi:glutathione peroxidase
MKYLIILGVIAVLGYFGYRYFGPAQKPEGAKSATSIYEYSYTSIDGKAVRLDAYRGKKILFVNVASKCGFTPQYDDLEKLYEQNKDRLVVLGFPANDFLGQEPGSNEEIASFCKLNYGVTFPLSEKVSVVGEGKHPIYRWLTDKSLNGWNSAEPKWNFHKYLVSEAGELLAVFPSSTKPGSAELLGYLK